MIDPQIPLVVTWGDRTDRARVDQTVDQLRHSGPLSRPDLRFLARFCVSVRAQWAQQRVRTGLVDEVESVDGRVTLGRWLGPYDERLGLVDPDETVIDEGATQW